MRLAGGEGGKEVKRNRKGKEWRGEEVSHSFVCSLE